MSNLEKLLVNSVDQNNGVDSKTMNTALYNIAWEIQRFNESIKDKNANIPEFSCKKIESSYIARLKDKKKQIRKLKENLKTTCAIAKTVIATKDYETKSLRNQLNFLSTENSDLIQKAKNYNDLLQKLSNENQNLQCELQNFKNFVDLGFEELQRINKESILKEKPSLINQLKKIIISCGKYFADYCVEREKCIHLENENRFLKNKRKLIQNNLQAAMAELQLYRNQKFGQRNNATHIIISHDSYNKTPNCKSLKQIPPNNINKLRKSFTNFDLTSHITLVKGLITNQEKTLLNLKVLSDELNERK